MTKHAKKNPFLHVNLRLDQNIHAMSFCYYAYFATNQHQSSQYSKTLRKSVDQFDQI